MGTHSFKRIAGKQSVPGAALFFTSPIASIIDSCVKTRSSNLGPTFSSLVGKNSFGFSILNFGSGWEKLDEYCSTSLIHISTSLSIFSPFISKEPILLLVLSFLFAYAKKCLGFDFNFSNALVSFTIFYSSCDSNNFLSISHIPFSNSAFVSAEFVFRNFLCSFFFFLSNILLSLGMLFDCIPPLHLGSSG